MSSSRLAVIVLAAGQGTRMKSALPKVLHPLAGKPILAHVLDAVAPLDPLEQLVVVGAGMEAVSRAAAPIKTVVQDPPRGTGDAVRVACESLTDIGRPGDHVLVAFGDTPLITTETLAALILARAETPRPEVVLLGFRPADPAGYGRIIKDEVSGRVAIVEHRDANDRERAVDLCNAGLTLVDGAVLPELLAQIEPNNAKNEYYLTDLAALAQRAGHAVAVREAPESQVMGINSRVELAAAEALLQARLRAAQQAVGVTMIDPATVWLSSDTRLAEDVVVEPNVFFGPGVTVGEGAVIRAFSHLEGAEVSAGATIGPFARLRPGSRIGRGARVGNFVETKNLDLGEGAKASHLTYLGDTVVGDGANIGAGTITCNYDGFNKHRTEIGPGAFIGSNSALVAPVVVGAEAIVAAGSTVVRDVPDQALAVARGRQENKAEAARRVRARLSKSKAKAS